jgi:hypothetical protein
MRMNGTRSQGRAGRARRAVGLRLAAAMLAAPAVVALVPTGAGPAAAADRVFYLPAGGQLGTGDRLVSPNGSHVLVLQGDGNAVVYAPGGRAIWSTQTNGRGTGVLRMQADGNLVAYSRSGAPVWSSRTEHFRGSELRMQDDGNLVLYRPGNRAVWSSRSQRWPALPSGDYVLSVTRHLTTSGSTYQVVPTQHARNLLTPAPTLWRYGWREAVQRGVPATKSLQEQFNCHVNYVRVDDKFRRQEKPSWNLDDWRPPGDRVAGQFRVRCNAN